MNFEQRLAETVALVDQRLGLLLPELGPGLTPDRLAEAMRYAVLNGGKRFRPFLVIECARLVGQEPARSLNAAAALECIHCYSLVHDDLPAMDNDDLRRGKPTLHRAYDDWTAVLAGDALQVLAFEVLADPATHSDPAVRSELILEVARASGRQGMAGGQCLDLEADKLGVRADVARVRRLQAMKTGALITVSCLAGAILGQASMADRARLVRFGETLGLAFQIADDLLDATGEVATVGKATAKDESAGKVTLVSLLGLDAAKTALATAEAEAIAALAPFGDAAAVLSAAARFVSRRTY